MGTYLSTPRQKSNPRTARAPASATASPPCRDGGPPWRTPSVSIVYTMIGDVCLYIVGKDEYDELDVCAKPPTERLFLDKYGRICLCLDEIVWQAVSELGAGAKTLLLSLEPPSSSDASGEYFFSDYGLGEPLASFPMHAYSRPQPSSCGNCILAIVPWKFLGLGLGLW
ncbi:hypothetical protein ZWY2020_021538 [Hordeum vulgare]|nr:hypothetical protein ZWY2020_021538 [Hordeum vulgare]